MTQPPGPQQPPQTPGQQPPPGPQQSGQQPPAGPPPSPQPLGQQPSSGPQNPIRPAAAYRGPRWDDRIWQRPADGSGTAPPPFASATKPNPPYAGPPPTIPAGPGWRPRTLIEVPAARVLPQQSDTALDEQERSQRTVTYGIGMMTGAIALIVLVVLCGRLLF